MWLLMMCVVVQRKVEARSTSLTANKPSTASMPPRTQPHANTLLLFRWFIITSSMNLAMQHGSRKVIFILRLQNLSLLGLESHLLVLGPKPLVSSLVQLSAGHRTKTAFVVCFHMGHFSQSLCDLFPSN